MKRILIFSLAYYPHIGGAEVAIKEITDRIASSDIEFHMLTLRFSSKDLKEEHIGNVFVHRVGSGSSYLSKILFIPRAAWTAAFLNKKFHFDGAWAMMSYMVFPLALLHLRGLRLPYVLNLQDGDPFEYVFKRWYIRPLSPLLTYGFKHATIVQPLSRYLAHWARTLGYNGPIEITPQGANISHFQKMFSEIELAAFRQTLNKKEGDVFLITTSRLVHKNAVDDVIRALPLLPDYVQFIVYGTGVEEYNLKKLAKDLGVSHRVQFMGHIGHNDMPKYLRVSDIFIRPSRIEGFGVSFVEAMAAGLPVIATQEGGIADFLFDAKKNPDKLPTGWAVDKDSPHQIAQAVKEIVGNPEQAKKVIENARVMVVSSYDWDIIAKVMREKVLEKIFKLGTK
jgi:glycosyltransferase involved in cell wall biosynthesis